MILISGKRLTTFSRPQETAARQMISPQVYWPSFWQAAVCSRGSRRYGCATGSRSRSTPPASTRFCLRMRICILPVMRRRSCRTASQGASLPRKGQKIYRASSCQTVGICKKKTLSMPIARGFRNTPPPCRCIRRRMAIKHDRLD